MLCCNLGALDLENRGLRAGRRRAPLRGQHAQIGDLERPQIDFDLRDLRGEQRILDAAGGRSAAPPAAMRFEPREFALGAADAGDIGALVTEQKLGVGPAAVLLADAILDRHPHILEPDLVDLMAAVEQRDGPDRDARTLHVDQQEGDAGLLLGVGIGAHQAENPIGILTERIPGLLAVDDVVHRPSQHGAGLQRRQIRAGAGFRIALAPPLLARELIFGRYRCCWAALPNAMITGATILMPKGIRRGAPASADSSSKMYCCTEFQPGPPNSLGQPMPPQPRSCRRRCHCRWSSRPSS